MNIVKTAIRDVLKKKGSLSNAKLRKAVLKVLAEDYPEGKEHEFNSKFDTELNSLVCKNKVAESDDKYHIPEDGPIDNKIGAVAVNIEPSSSSSSSKRKSADEQPAAKATKHVKIDDSGDTTEKASMKELWNTGEKHWREGTFEAGYLEKNPDRITRLFCGNLNKKMTEDDIKGCLSGITHIKWITDKETGEFYGSSFLEMKDAGCAAAAVAMDKQKFMGRYIDEHLLTLQPSIYSEAPVLLVLWSMKKNEGKKLNEGARRSSKVEEEEGRRKCSEIM
jgi:RNA recognition motif-containing protein